MIRFVTAAMAALLVVAPVYAADPPAAPVSIKAPEGAKQGAVAFPHAKHAKQECAKCHADKANAKTVPAVQGVKGGDMKSTAHELCLNCHKENKGPASCTTCHAKKA
jgi:Cytochrome c7 and related cytochrome c